MEEKESNKNKLERIGKWIEKNKKGLIIAALVIVLIISIIQG